MKVEVIVVAGVGHWVCGEWSHGASKCDILASRPMPPLGAICDVRALFLTLSTAGIC
jgi:hypothetical protein